MKTKAKTIANEKTKTISVRMKHDVALLLFQYLHNKPIDRAIFTGHWQLDLKDHTVTLAGLSILQAASLDVLMVEMLRSISDVVESLDYALGSLIKE